MPSYPEVHPSIYASLNSGSGGRSLSQLPQVGTPGLTAHTHFSPASIACLFLDGGRKTERTQLRSEPGSVSPWGDSTTIISSPPRSPDKRPKVQFKSKPGRQPVMQTEAGRAVPSHTPKVYKTAKETIWIHFDLRCGRKGGRSLNKCTQGATKAGEWWQKESQQAVALSFWVFCVTELGQSCVAMAIEGSSW